MAAAKAKNRPLRTLIFFFVILIALAGTLVSSALLSNGSFVPKLAIDLEGGTQLILTPKVIDGAEGTVTTEDIDQAIEVIRQRVDASGVAEAEIARNGSENISVGLPGKPTDETLNLVRSSAVMRFRTVLLSGNASFTSNEDPAATAAAIAGGISTNNPGAPTEKIPDPNVGQTQQIPAPSETGSTQSLVFNAAEPADVSGGDTDKEPSNTQTVPAGQLTPAPTAENMSKAAIPYDELMKQAQQYPDTPVGKSTVINDPKHITVRDMFIFQHLDCTDPASLKGGSQYDNPEKNLVTCSKQSFEKYILGPEVLSGTDVDAASSGMGHTSQGQSTGQWEVALKLDSKGAKKFDEIAKVLYPNNSQDGARNPDNNRFAIVLDSLVVSAPGINAPSYGGSATISGSLTRESSATLANQLQFGSLPLNFEVQSEQRISATLGSEHLKVGVYAAVVGLVLVVLYLLWQYHALAGLATASLILAGILTYLVVAILSWSMGYRLSLAGVVGLIVAVGITMDSFIIYFERIRDEVRDGKPLATAVETGWNRAKRTILISDVVNMVAAVVLYVLAVGGVQGFAFTLGLTTVMDLAIVFMFTHPVMSLLVKTRYFGEGRKFSGLDTEHLGAGNRTYMNTVARNKSTKASRKVAQPTISLARKKAGISQITENTSADEKTADTPEESKNAEKHAATKGEEPMK